MIKLTLASIILPEYEYEYQGISRIYTYLAARGFDVDIVNIPVMGNKSESEIKTEIDKMNVERFLESDIVGFTIFNDTVDYVFAFAHRIKSLNLNIIFHVGSRFATLTAKELLRDCSAIDFIVLGDGEIPEEYILNHLNKEKSLDSIKDYQHVLFRDDKSEFKKPYFADITKMPWPLRNPSLMKKRQLALMVTSNTCKGYCSFCSVNIDKNIKWMGRAPKDFAMEIFDINQKYKINYFFFSDPSFEDPGEIGKKRIEEFCNLVAEYPYRLSFLCYMRTETFTDCNSDRRLLSLMREVGFTQVFLGIDGANDEDLKLYNKRATLEENENIMRLLKEVDIEPTIGFIMFNPYSDEGRIKKNFLFLKRHEICFLSRYVSHLWVFYNSRIYHQLNKENLLNDNYSYKNVEEFKIINPVVSEISHFLKSKIMNTQLAEDSFKFFNFLYYFNSLKGILYEQIRDHEKTFNEISREMAKVLTDYFEHLFINLDIGYCERNLSAFIKDMELLYQKNDLLKKKLMALSIKTGLVPKQRDVFLRGGSL